MQIKEQIKEYALHLGFDLVGFTTAEPFDETKGYLQHRLKQGYRFPFKMQDIENITDPCSLLDGAKSVIALGISYSVSPELIPPKPKTTFMGRISRYTWGIDYHRVLIEKMNKLTEFINSVKPSSYRVLVDTGSFLDKPAARRAGLGWISKNTCITNSRYGSWIFLGEIITDLELEPDQPSLQNCGECKRCLDVCPTGALFKPYHVDPYRCLSYLTQKRGWIPWELREKFGNRLYGCDTCQEGCSINQQAEYTNHKEFIPVILPPYIDIRPLFEMTKKQFKKTFGPSAAGWVGLRTILRNAVIVMGNTQYEGAEPYLLKAMEHPSPIIRGHAAWALTKCLKKRALPILEKAYLYEKDEKVKTEIKLSVDEILKRGD